MNCLKQCKAEHLSSEDIINILQKNNTPVGAATVYRNLINLQKAGLVRKYRMDSKRSSCYQYIEDRSCVEHFHLVCLKCAKTVHFQDKKLLFALKNLNSHDFILDVPKTIFYGLCSECKNSKQGGC